MRIIDSIAHPSITISIFQMNDKYLVKFEAGPMEQVFKFSIDELKKLITKLKCKPLDIVRKKEPLFEQNYAGKTLSDEEWIKVLSKNPILIERPIVINGNQAIIGRPPQLVLNII